MKSREAEAGVLATDGERPTTTANYFPDSPNPFPKSKIMERW